jgi:hypothetical protein
MIREKVDIKGKERVVLFESYIAEGDVGSY